MLIKTKLCLLIIVSLLTYMAFGIYQINQAHPVVVIHAAVYSNWDYFDTKILPFPFRRFFAKHEFDRRSFSELKNTPVFDMNLYTIFSVKGLGEINTEAEQARLEKIADKFLEKGVSLKHKTNRGCDALKMVILNKDSQAVRYLIGKGLTLDDTEEISGISFEVNDKNPCSKSKKYLLEKYLPELEPTDLI